MVEGVLLGPLLLFAAVMCLTPGPNVVMVTASVANFGFRRAIPHMLGISIGFGGLVGAAGLGLAGVVHSEPRLHALLQDGGAIYLLYLAWRIARAEPAAGRGPGARPIGFVEAALFQWVNPKGWVIAVGAFAAYTTADGDVLAKASLMAALLALICLTSVLLWAGGGAAIGRWLGDPRARAAFNWTMAGLLVMSLIPVFR